MSTPPRPLLGIASHIYLITLPSRHDRHTHMHRLRTSLDLIWTTIDATPATDPIVHRLLDWVVHQRVRVPLRVGGRAGVSGDVEPELESESVPGTESESVFRWPREIDAFAILTHTPLSPSPSDVWTTQSPPPIEISSPDSMPRLMSAVDDYSTPTGILSLVDWMRLTPARVACWHSHVSAMRTFVDRDGARPEDVGVFLEDDVDMERDVADRLSGIWASLPAGWDIVMLGHCWSNEATFPALPTPSVDGTRLHPSYSPKCTHAYALSLSGARRLIQHLRYPPFAYSRALDHAFSWLIESGRLRAYSVVPSVVVQRKDTPSDILAGFGSERTEWLVNGVLESNGDM